MALRSLPLISNWPSCLNPLLLVKALFHSHQSILTELLSAHTAFLLQFGQNKEESQSQYDVDKPIDIFTLLETPSENTVAQSRLPQPNLLLRTLLFE